MKPFYTKVTTDYHNPISIRKDELPHFYRHWHYHDEYELVYVHKSSGLRYVGDSIAPYFPGDLVLMGSCLPHIWMDEYDETEPPEKQAIATIIHFQRKFVHSDFLQFPSMENIKNLFAQSARGIRFIGLENIETQLTEILEKKSTDRMMAILNLLNQMCKHEQTKLLSSTYYRLPESKREDDRLSKIHDYILRHFREKMTLKELSAIAMMTPPAFSNYFKNKTRKSVFTYINDLKIGYSCRLLIETDWNIDQVAFKSGYNNTTFFNRKFKEKMSQTPKSYRKRFLLENRIDERL
ncbi:MAG: AraC family transcriptional regulator [Bacteroidota bacterium]